MADEDAEQNEIRSLSRKFWIGLGLTIPVFVLTMGSLVPGLDFHAVIPREISKWIGFAHSTPVTCTTNWAVSSGNLRNRS